MFQFNVIVFLLLCFTSMEGRFVGKNIETPPEFLSQNLKSSIQKEQPNIETSLLHLSQPETGSADICVFNLLKKLPAITQSQQSTTDSNVEPRESDATDISANPEYAMQKRFLFLNIKLTLNVDMDGGARRRYEVTVPVGHVISVFEAFVEAASSLRDSYSNAENPFNMGLQYNEDGTCLHIIRAFGLEVDHDHVWRIDIKKRGGQSLYTGVCVPGRFDIRVGPFYEINLTYSHINSASI